MIGRKHLLAGAAFVAGLAAMVGDAKAATLAALTGARTLLIIDTDRPAVTGTVNVGVRGRLIGIDVRPADGQLYGVLAGGGVVIINPSNGQVQQKPRLAQTLPPGVRASVDFNPARDRLRLVGSDGTNLAANVDDGTVVQDTNINFAPMNPFGGTTPSVIGVAYTNSVAGSPATLLFDVDDSTDALYLQQPPAAGTLAPVGRRLGINPGQSFGFDIGANVGGENFPFLINGNQLFRPGLLSGRGFPPRTIGGLNAPVRDLAVLSLN